MHTLHVNTQKCQQAMVGLLVKVFESIMTIISMKLPKPFQCQHSSNISINISININVIIGLCNTNCISYILCYIQLTTK